MSELAERIAALTPKQRELLELRLKQKGGTAARAPVIPRRAGDGRAPLSFAQQRLWFLHQLDPGGAAYNIAVTLGLTGRLDAEVLRRSFDEVVRRHEILRTSVVTVDDEPSQWVAPSLTPELPVSDLTELPAAERRAAAERLAAEEARQPFDLEAGPLMRVRLVRLEEDEHLLLLTMHHIISDGWSLGVFMREVATLYEAYSEGRESPLAELPVQYADYAAWQRDWLSGQRLEELLDYWKGELAGAPVLELPTDRPRPRVRSSAGRRSTFSLGREVASALDRLGRREGATPFMTQLCAFHVLLARYSGRWDVTVGTPIAGRTVTEAEGLIGLFVNTLAVRTRIEGGESFREALRKVREAALGAQQHQEAPFELIVDALQPARDLSHTPLFQVMFILQNTSVPSINLRGLTLRQLPVESGTAKFDLTLEMEETPDGLGATFEYSADLFDEATVRRMAEHFRTLLEAVVADPDRPVEELPLLTEEERGRLLVKWNDTATEHGTTPSLHSLFEEQAMRTPDNVALVFKGVRLTYAELDRRASALARRLRRLGVGPDAPVGVLMERSAEMVVALLGVLKAGGAYLPLDPSYPAERLRHMLEDARPPVVLAQRRLLDSLPEHASQVVCLGEAEEEEFSRGEVARAGAVIDGDNLAYVIYTSGSTGKPKGAMNTHRSIVNRLLWMQDEYGLTPDDVVLQKTPFSFDVSVWEFFWPLLVGARLVVAEPGGHQDPSYLVSLIERERVTTVHFVPSMLQAFLPQADPERCATLRRVICSGEALSRELQERFQERLDAGLHNLYGPTEAAVDVTCWACERGDRRRSVPIGRPIANTRIYVLDKLMQPTPIGVPGELYIGGVQLARGYLNRPGLTAERFVPDPFSAEAGARLYRTGDLSRFMPGGEVEYLGRLDFQVKIRGFRIELGEVEAALAEHASVRECVVTAGGAAERPQLVAYVVRDGADESGAGELRRYLLGRLPEYMIPSAFVFMDALPLNNSGKVDRRALPAPDSSRRPSERSYVAPRTAAEETLAAIWAEALGLERVGVNDNFFELGGDSILSIQIISKANRAGLRLLPKQIFEFQTVAELAAASGTSDEAAPDEAPQEAVAGPLPLTPVQRWFFERELPEPHHFNQSVLLEAPPDVDASALERAVERVVEHHDVLRLRFVREGSGWRQENARAEDARVFSTHDLSALPAEERAGALETEGARLQASLDLARGPLMRAALFLMGERLPARLLFVVHHLAVDGVSWRVLLEDVRSAYEQFKRGAASAELPPKTASFKQWAEALVEYARTEELRREADYWAGVVGGEGLRALPADGDGEVAEATAETLTVTLDEDETRDLLQRVPEAYRARANEALLSALAAALAEWAGPGRYLVNLEGHGREEIRPPLDVSRTVGWFTTIYPVALEARTAEPPGEALKRVKEQLRAVPRSGFGYGLLRYLTERGDGRPAFGSARPEMVFNYLGQLDRVLAPDSEFRAARESAGRAVSPRAGRAHALEVDAHVALGRLHVSVRYSPELHRRETVERFARGYLAALRRLVAHCREEGAGGFTPSDFPLARLSQPELDRVAGTDREVENVYPLSPMQQGLFFHTLYEPGGGAYVTQLSYEVAGGLDARLLRAAWERVVARHAALRTAFAWEGLDEPVQVVRRRVEVPLAELDWGDVEPGHRQTLLAQLLEDDRRRGFDLSAGPLMRLAVARLSDELHYVVWSHHHILLDGWCVPILLEEVSTLYEALRRGEEASPAPARPYSDYIAWLQRQDPSGAEAFWRATLAGFGAPTPLPGGRADGDGFGEQEMSLDARTTRALRDAARRHRVTLNTVMQGAWALLLSRHSGERDVLFGVTVSGRPAELPGVESMIGLFINTLPLRVEVGEDEPLGDWLRRLHGRQAAMQQYEHSPLVEVQGWSDVPRGTPLFESILVFENYPLGALAGRLNERGGGLEVLGVSAKEQTNYPLTVYAAPGDEFFVKLNYDRSRVGAKTVGRLLKHLRALFEAIAAEPEQSLGRLPSLTGDDRRRLIEEWNGTRAPYPRGLCIHELFEAQAERTPQAEAVVFGDVSLSYAELNERAEVLARRLRRLGVGPGELAAVMVERSAEMVVALLGVLKAGAAYVPLDPSYPCERLELMLEDARPRVLITEEPLLERAPRHDARVFCVGHGGDDADGSDETPPAHTPARPEDLAYVIYTSGSTGRPKGVAVPHSAVVNFLWHMRREPGLAERDTLLAVTTLSFDIAALEIYLPLVVGARLVVADRETAADASLLAEALRCYDVTAMQATPTTWRMLVESGWGGWLGLKVLCGGEALGRDLAEQLVERAGEVWNLYGPTETTIWSAALRVRGGAGTPTIGRPISNTQLYVLDARGGLMPPGAVGELYIGGAGVARGYLNRPALTTERFVPDEFSPAPGARLYRTGDAARWLEEGEVEYLGRLDFQVKVRGFRIELGEVEAALAEHPAVASAVVVAREEQGGGKRLVAYMTPAAGAAAPSVGELRAHVGGRLPDYMTPSVFVMLERMPLTPNGKVDRRALPAPDAAGVASGAEYVAPRTGVESLLAELWAGVIGVERVGAEDDFFELGGHSLTATRLVSRVRQTFGVELPLRELFERPTVAAMAESVGRALKSGARAEQPPPVTPVERDGALPLSFAQQRLWFLDQLEAGTNAYNVPAALRLTGPLDAEALSRSLAEVVRRHEVLRTTFADVGGRPVQVVTPPPLPEPLPTTELSSLPEEERERAARRLAEEEARAPFDLSSGPLLRARLLRLSEEEHVLLFTMHHIVCDAWSLGVLVKEVAALYEAFSQGQPSPLAELPVQYADFAAWQQEWLSGETLERHLDYWKERLGGELPVLELPVDRPRPAFQTRQGASQSFDVPEGVADRLRRLGRGEGATLYMTLLAAFKALLHRHTGQTDIIVGTPVANRSREELEPLIGFFANTLVLRTSLDGDPTFRELLGRVRETALGAYAHEDMPFEKLVAELQPARDLSRTPLFNVLFTLQNAPMGAPELSRLRITPEATGSQATKFDLAFNLFEAGGRIEGGVEYNTDLFDDATMTGLLRRLQTLLAGVAEDPARRLSALPLLDEEERRLALVEFNDTRADFERGLCLHQLFERRAAQAPSAEALSFEGRGMTYAELNARSNQLARYLLASGVGRSSLVAVCLEHGFETFVALLGILKAGAAYVPLDPAHPRQRLARTLAGARPAALLTQEHLKARLAELLPPNTLCLDAEWPRVAEHDSADLPPSATPDDAAYVLYTSGSTGEPKGVVVTHASAVNYVAWARRMYMPEEEPISCAFYSSLAFDLTVTSVFAPLSGGHRVRIYRRSAAADVPLLDLFEDNRVEVVKLTPSHLALVKGRDNRASRVRRLIVGGEALTVELARAVSDSFGGAVEIFNEYGPTEATVGCMIHRYAPERDTRAGVPIGRPAANTRLYVLDARMQPVAGGVRNELYVGGAGVARGYLNQPALTAERFVPDPFSAEPGSRLYRTGDVARRLADGTLEYLGRGDEQVKYHGHRVELGEIMSAFNEHPEVTDSVVVVSKDEGGAELMAAYYVAPREISWGELRDFLAERVVEETLPSVYVRLPRLPLTFNGKVDKTALPAPEAARPKLKEAFVGSRTPTEEMLAGIWARTLRVGRVGVNDNFFELGGHSLLATQVASRVREAFGVELPLRELFERPTVAALAEAVEAAMREGAGLAVAPLRPAARDDGAELPLSFAQQRLWFLDQLEPGSPLYNIPAAVRLTGRLDTSALGLAFAELVRRHESLRTTFPAEGGRPRQVVAPPAPPPLPVEDLTRLSVEGREAEAARIAAEEARKPFDLSAGPLLRLRLLRLSEEEHVLLLTMHHIISDGWSMGIVIREAAALYEAFSQGQESPLPDLPVQYADFAAWQREHLAGETLEQQLSYWREQLKGVETLELPTDRPRGAAQSHRGAVAGVTLDAELTRALRELSANEGATLFMTLLAAFKVLLSRYTGQADISVGTPVAGRTRAETEGLIGFFLNTLVLRTDLSGDPTFRELLARARETALGAYTHQDVPFEKLVEELQPDRDLGRAPLFQVMFNHLNFTRGEIALPGLVVRPLGDPPGLGAKFDLTLNAAEDGDELNLTLAYKADLFDAPTVARMCEQLRALLEAAAADPGRPVGSYTLLSESESQALIGDFTS